MPSLKPAERLAKVGETGPVKAIARLGHEYSIDHVGQLSAAFSYYALFAIGPLLLIIASVAGWLFGQDAVNGQLAKQLTSQLGSGVANTIQDVVARTYQLGHGSIGLIVGVVVLILTASGLFGQLRGSFDQIFRVVHDPKAPRWHGIVWPRVKGVVLLAIISAFIIATTAVSAFLTSAVYDVGQKYVIVRWLLELVNFVASTAVIGLLMGIIYRTVPDVVVPRRLALRNGFIVAALFSVGKTILGIIIGNSKTASAYGAAASFIALLLWVFYFGQLIFIGAENIKLAARRRGLTLRTRRYYIRQREPIQ